MQDVHGRTAIVTGATDGIGERVAETLFARGATVVIVSRHAEAAEAKARALDPTGERCMAIACDVADEWAVEALVATSVERFGALHLAVNNAGITGPGGTSLADTPLDDWNAVVATNLTGTFLCLKHQIPAIAAAGGGAVVNMSAANGTVGVPGIGAYTATKHGILGLTRTAALEAAADGVRVNAVGPGYVDTPRMRQTPGDILDAMRAGHPMRRLASRTEVAEVVAFLLSDAAGFCTGGFYPVDGGYTAQ